MRSKRDLWLETGAVLALAVFPDAAYSAYPWIFGGDAGVSDVPRWGFQLLVRSVAVSVPVLYLMARSGESWSRFGLVRPRWGRDPAVAVASLVALLGLLRVFQLAALLWVGESFYASPEWCWDVLAPEGAWQHALLAATHVANAFAEELVVRGYLIPRFERLLGSAFDAVLVSSFLFALYHTYRGPGAAVDLFVWGLFLGFVFVRTRRLWPCVAVHALWNLAIVEYGIHRAFCAW